MVSISDVRTSSTTNKKFWGEVSKPLPRVSKNRKNHPRREGGELREEPRKGSFRFQS